MKYFKLGWFFFAERAICTWPALSGTPSQAVGRCQVEEVANGLIYNKYNVSEIDHQLIMRLEQNNQAHVTAVLLISIATLRTWSSLF